MYHYVAFCLRWASNQPIPQLPFQSISEQQPDIVVWQGRRPNIGGLLNPLSPLLTTTAPDENLCVPVRISGSNFFRVLYRDGCEFFIDLEGKEVWATWPPSMTVEDMATYLLGPIAGFVLRLRGVLALHASAVLIDDVAVAFVGPAGAGKSTTAAAFALRGLPVLADDVSAIDDVDGNFFVRSAYPHLRLWPPSVELLFGQADSLPPITPNWDKRDFSLRAIQRFCDQSARLIALYLLDSSQGTANPPALTPLNGGQRLMTLVTNTYKNHRVDLGDGASEFRALAKLAERVPARRLTVHKGPRGLDDLHRLIIEDVRCLQGTSPGCHFSTGC